MKHARWLSLILLCALSVTGCSVFNSVFKPDAAQTSKTTPKVIVTPGTVQRGRVASVNTAGQFVVVAFELGQAPAPNQKLDVYRSELKVGELKVSAQKQGQNVVADIVAGEVQIGDVTRLPEATK